MGHAYGPKQPDHPSIGDRCPACHEPFTAGCYTALVPLGPGADPDARIARNEGRPYNAVALEVHYDCATAEVR